MYNFGAVILRTIILTSQSGGVGRRLHGGLPVLSAQLRTALIPMWEPTIPNTAVTHAQCITILINVKINQQICELAKLKKLFSVLVKPEF